MRKNEIDRIYSPLLYRLDTAKRRLMHIYNTKISRLEPNSNVQPADIQRIKDTLTELSPFIENANNQLDASIPITPIDRPQRRQRRRIAVQLDLPMKNKKEETKIPKARIVKPKPAKKTAVKAKKK